MTWSKLPWRYFMFGFVLGLLFLPFSPSSPPIVIYPHTSTIHTYQIKDSTQHQCFQYTEVSATCPSKPDTIPVQEGFFTSR